MVVSTPFLSAILTSYVFIMVTEIGDKTFFIAALLAMKQGALVTFAGAITALIIMTVLSAVAGSLLPVLIKPNYTHMASIALFVFFGVRLLLDAWKMENKVATEELEAVELELEASKKAKDGIVKVDDLELHPRRLSIHGQSPISKLGRVYLFMASQVSRAYLEALTLTFAAEWGDRSQITTIALGASKNIWGVNIGGILGHASCTALAVLGGKFLASRISEKTITLIAGVTFLCFAFIAVAFDATSDNPDAVLLPK